MGAVLEFCDLHGLSMRLRDRLRENYQLEHQYYEGVALPENTKYLMYDAPFFFSDDALYAEIGTHLEGVPPFSVWYKCNSAGFIWQFLEIVLASIIACRS